MQRSGQESPSNRGFWLSAGVSLAVHAGVLLAVGWFSAQKPALPPLQKAIPVELVKLGKPRDPTLLPRKAPAPAPAPEPTPAPKPEPAPEPEPAPAPKPAAQPEAKAEPPAPNAVPLETKPAKPKPAKPKPDPKPEPKPKAKPEPKSKPSGKASGKAKPAKTAAKPKLSSAAAALLKGDGPGEGPSDAELDKALSKLKTAPEGSEHGSVYGTTTDLNLAAEGYLAEVSQVLRRAYKLPDTIPRAERRFLTAEVKVYIESDGRIRRFQFVKKHPNAAFMSALESLLKAIKLPPPPPKLATRFKRGQLLEFTP